MKYEFECENDDTPISLGTTFNPYREPVHSSVAPAPTDSTMAPTDVTKREKGTKEDARKLALPSLATITWMRIQIFDNSNKNTKGQSQYAVKLDYCTGKVNSYKPDGSVYISMLPGSKIKPAAKKYFPDEESAASFYEPLLDMRRDNPELRVGFVAVKSPKLGLGTVTFEDQFAILNFDEKRNGNEVTRIAKLVLVINGEPLDEFEMEEIDRDRRSASKFLAYYDPNDYNTERKNRIDD